MLRRDRIHWWIGGPSLVLMVLALFAASYTSSTARADESSAGDNVVDSSETDGEEASEETEEEEGVSGISLLPEEGKLSLIQLAWRGGLLMIVIFGMAFLVVMFGIERGLALRRSRVMPEELVESLGRMANAPGGFDPRKAYRECQKYPSAAAAVIKSMLLKVGRPHEEVERTVKEASNREASRLYGNVRWLNLAAAVTPLMGLLGTVWGMILAFFQTANLPEGVNKADALAEGIYVALVTTLGGLSVAIPAAVLAHFFESRIESLFHQIDEMLFNLLPQIERFEGRLRVSQQSLTGSETVAAEQAVDATVVESASSPEPAAVK